MVTPTAALAGSETVPVPPRKPFNAGEQSRGLCCCREDGYWMKDRYVNFPNFLNSLHVLDTSVSLVAVMNVFDFSDEIDEEDQIINIQRVIRNRNNPFEQYANEFRGGCYSNPTLLTELQPENDVRPGKYCIVTLNEIGSHVTLTELVISSHIDGTTHTISHRKYGHDT
uniref:Uncharacterized protein n=1 Tax=Romanomermis culicivorax TaxID=13658 RepID=A0A915KV85_ROMCU